MADQKTPFDYLLNAVLHAAQADKPAEHGYKAKREALYAHVRELERRAALYVKARAELSEIDHG